MPPKQSFPRLHRVRLGRVESGPAEFLRRHQEKRDTSASLPSRTAQWADDLAEEIAYVVESAVTPCA
jgi:hypothetical protein